MNEYTAKDFKKGQPRWCPGCGDHFFLASLHKAMAELGVAPHDTAVISQKTYRSKSYKQVRNKYQRHIFFTRNQCKYFHYNSPLHIENIYLYNDNRFLPFRIDFFMFIG